MSEPIRLSPRDARRLAVRAQLLTADRPADAFEVVQDLSWVKIDPVKAVAPSADLVLWSRLGSAYDPRELVGLLDRGDVVEYQSYLYPAEGIAVYRAEMRRWAEGEEGLKDWQRDLRDWVLTNEECREDVLRQLEADGPTPSRDLPDTCVQPWRSTGWTNNKNITKMLDVLAAMGEVAVAGRRGRDRLWDLAERVYPDDPVPAPEEADLARARLRLRTLGLARAKGTLVPGEPHDVGEVGEAAVVDGVRGTWRVDPDLLDVGPFRGRTALLSPLDRLVFDRERIKDLFDFDYQLEMYKPVAQRKWGYYALPVLHGERLVGKVDATADHKAGVLRVDAVHEDEGFTKAAAAGVDRELADLAAWLELDLVRAG